MSASQSPPETLNALERGAGQPIVLVHGWPSSAKVWKYQLDGLSDRHHVIALDMPGYGETPPMEGPSMRAYAALVKDYLDDRGLDDVILGGWSMGGGVVMSYSQYFGGHRLAGLCIVDDCPKLYPDEGWVAGVDSTFDREAVDRWDRIWKAGDRRAVVTELTNSEFADPARHADDVKWLIEESLTSDPSVIAALHEALELDFRESLRRVEVPTLLLYGAHSNMTTAANRAFMEKTIPDATLVTFTESGHNPFIEEPDKFNREVAAFAERLRTGPRQD